MILDDRESCTQFHKKCDINDHWKPFSQKCSFCEINYRVIAKIEAFERDRKFIGRLVGVDFENLMDLGKVCIMQTVSNGCNGLYYLGQVLYITLLIDKI